MAILTLNLDPLDVLFFRDGQAFTSGGRAGSGYPTPQTLGGALRSHLMEAAGCDFHQFGDDIRSGLTPRDAARRQSPALEAALSMRLRGPWLKYDGTIMLPTPVTVLRVRGGSTLVRLDPSGQPVPGWRDSGEQGLAPLWPRTRARTEAAGGYLALEAMADFLAGRTPPTDGLVPANTLFAIEHRTGIAVDSTAGTAAEGMIYGIGFLRLRPGVRFVVEIETDAGVPPLGDFLLRWGGEGRHVACSVADTPVQWPGGPALDGSLAVLTTPAFLSGGWHGDDWHPLAVACGEGQAISGWDLARRAPKPTRFAVPAGAVFYFASGRDSVLERTSLSAGDDVANGFGCFLKGGWTYA
ncbi:MAG: type III-B CRISPR module-associated protein Cmr3 [Pseudomonadota bacterium]|nr:type III-B CRISPR module-associated protein Cmr3 [Pseudomonadota bacterium]